jgi:hypothetical protein
MISGSSSVNDVGITFDCDDDDGDDDNFVKL